MVPSTIYLNFGFLLCLIDYKFYTSITDSYCFNTKIIINTENININTASTMFEKLDLFL